MKRVNAADAKRLQDEGWAYVDVRTPAEFAAGHPQGAINLPFNAPDFPEQFAKRFPQKDAKVVIGCQVGGRSMRATAQLEGQGYTQLVDNSAGFDGWSSSKLPIAKGNT